ncbi:MAG: histidine--tRNA ligase [Hyphomicrobium sp. SCN 65-11]|nr:MAG: histidine--tRNA ligase [Hyphomicrobium sp. SCN 65-11]
MQKLKKDQRPEARLPKGFQDTGPADARALARMLTTIREVYESYGFEPLETSAIEYTDALGKFLPDLDRPNAGVFSFQDEDEQWLSLRYDLTAPLARYVAENYDRLPKPYRRYATGPVWRNEKPGPGRFRQFTQFDADTVGSESVAADAEICMLAADTMERLGIKRGDYVLKVNNRKVLDGVMEAIGLAGEEHAASRLTVLRAIDKLDRLGVEGVRALLGKGRKDESGDFTKGAGLDEAQIAKVIGYVSVEAAASGRETVARLRAVLDDTAVGREGLDELDEIAALAEGSGYGADRIRIDPSVVRGLEYYTGPVFEAELTFKVTGDDGQPVRFGSVGGGGRYDDLVARFTGQRVPATGFSIGVSRLLSALQYLKKGESNAGHGPVVVLVMDRKDLPRYQRLAQRLRQAGISAEMYLGTSGMKAQMKYADRRGAPCVVIQGGDEIAKGEVQIKDLIEGAKASETIKDAKEWREGRPAQFSVSEDQLVSAVKGVLERHSGD